MWDISSCLLLLKLLMVPNLQVTNKNSVSSDRDRRVLASTCAAFFSGSCCGVQFLFHPSEVSHLHCSTPTFVAIGGACYMQQNLRKQLDFERKWHLNSRKYCELHSNPRWHIRKCRWSKKEEQTATLGVRMRQLCLGETQGSALWLSRAHSQYLKSYWLMSKWIFYSLSSSRYRRVLDQLPSSPARQTKATFSVTTWNKATVV